LAVPAVIAAFTSPRSVPCVITRIVDRPLANARGQMRPLGTMTFIRLPSR